MNTYSDNKNVANTSL